MEPSEFIGKIRSLAGIVKTAIVTLLSRSYMLIEDVPGSKKRPSPKTQSALLEAMNKARATIDGTSYDIPNPSMVIATQNPFEYKGTSPLPEDQLDRFALRISIGYPDRESEKQILS